jgi:hypothetical protein
VPEALPANGSRAMLRALDGHAEPTLVPRANSGHAAGQNLAALLYELRKDIRALVVDEVHLLDTEFADLLLAKILALATARAAGSSGTSRTATRTTFATPATWSAFAASSGMPTTFTARGALVPAGRTGRTLPAFRAVAHGSGCGGLPLLLFL